MAESQRTFSSSSSGSDYLTSLSSISTHSSCDDQNHVLQALKSLDATLHPYSKLHQLHQQGVLIELSYENKGQENSIWKANISAYGKECGELNAVALGGSVKEAKRSAAQSILDQIDFRISNSSSSQSTSPPLPSASSLSLSTCSLSSSTSSPLPLQSVGVISLTKRQKVQLDLGILHLQAIRSMWLREFYGTLGKYLSIDVEAYELDKSRLLEVGLAWTSVEIPLTSVSNDSTSGILSRHLIVSDNLSVKNGRFVSDHRYNFNFGRSELVNLQDLATSIQQVLEDITSGPGPVHLIGASVESDINWLKQIGINTERFNNLKTCDIARAYQAQQNYSETTTTTLTSLGRMMDEFGIGYENLHNGGNDAVYSLQVLRAIIKRMGQLRWKTPLKLGA